MPHRWWIWLILALAIGALLGAMFAPRYHPPAQATEARLRERAVAFYRAGRLLDYWTMSRCFTPARQLAEAEQLSAKARQTEQSRRAFQQETNDDLERAAAAVQPDKIEVELDGAWAVTQGTSLVYADGVAVPRPLEPVVWVRNAGEWWVYSLTKAELNAYGNPPEFARKLLAKDDSGHTLVESAEPPAPATENQETTPSQEATP